jgi:hypothetical protein
LAISSLAADEKTIGPVDTPFGILSDFDNPNRVFEVYIPKNLVDVTGEMGAVN